MLWHGRGRAIERGGERWREVDTHTHTHTQHTHTQHTLAYARTHTHTHNTHRHTQTHTDTHNTHTHTHTHNTTHTTHTHTHARVFQGAATEGEKETSLSVVKRLEAFMHAAKQRRGACVGGSQRVGL